MPHPAIEFMRHTAADAPAHARSINEQRARLDRALRAADALSIVDAAADLASLLTTDRQEADALHLLRAHAAAAEALPHEEAAGWFCNAYATALQYAGQRAEADRWFAKALGLSRAAGWTRLQALVLHHWGRSLAEQRRFDDAQARFTEALALRVQRGDASQDSSRRALAALAQLRSAAGATVALEPADQPDVIGLIAELDAYQDSLYPPESRHALDLAALTQPDVVFAVARDGSGLAVACGAVVLNPAFGELKRLFVSPAARGQGLALRLLAQLEGEAEARGCALLQLETGPFQPEALGLYARCGYQRRGPFGGYADDPLSVFMEKRLGAAVTAPAADPA